MLKSIDMDHYIVDGHELSFVNSVQIVSEDITASKHLSWPRLGISHVFNGESLIMPYHTLNEKRKYL